MTKTRYFVLASMLLTSHACREEEPQIADRGYLSLQISAISIDASPTGGRTKAVSTDNFIVKIFRVGEADPVETFDPWSSAPAKIELETGEYYAEAQNLNPPAPAAFEQPWYYGRSDDFTIDKEELKTIEIDCSLANFKVAFVYSQNVLDNFTNWRASAELVSEDIGLLWQRGDNREGYFITSPLSIEVYLEYTKVFTGERITRVFTASIANPEPATLYRIRVDASLDDGAIKININVDDSFDVVDIQLGDGEGGGEEDENTVTDADGNVYPTVQIGDQVWMAQNLSVTQLNDGTPIANVVDATWQTTTTPAYCWYNNNEASFKNPYGGYYNFYTVETGKLCPVGWHVPSIPEWDQLRTSIGGSSQGGKLKETGTAHWTPNSGATNETGFTAVGTGYRNTSGVNWFSLHQLTWMWSNDNAQFRHLSGNNGFLGDGGASRALGLTVRCIKN